MKFLTSRQFYEVKQSAKRGIWPAWRSAVVLLLALAMAGLTPLAAMADTHSPAAVAQSRPSTALQLYTAGVQMAPLMPDLLGFTKPKSYLLLLQNNQELRATGGFITAVGKITVTKGRVSELKLEDSYSISRNNVAHPLAPEPLKQFMGIELLFLRDANWSPDFPTTARLAASLYAQDAGVQTDGVIAVDLQAVQLLVGALAPLQIPGSDIPLTSENVMDQILAFRESPAAVESAPGDVTGDANSDANKPKKPVNDWLLDRKDFIPLIAEAAFARLQSGNFNILRLLNFVTSALDERAVQIWLADSTATNLLAHYGWDGRLQPEAGADYLALVDTNMGYNKADAAIERSMTHRVTWPNGAAAPAQATVTVTYRHPLKVVDTICSPQTSFYKDNTYSDMIARCYFDYVRLYVPGGSKLITLDGVQADSISTQPGERGTQLFSGYFFVKPGEQQTLTFTYTLPPTITPQNYRLVVQRQAGIGPLPLSISVDDRTFANQLNTTLVAGSLTWPAPAPEIAKAK